MTGEVCELLCLDLPKAEELRRASPTSTLLEAAAERGKALSDPTRLLIATALSPGGELCVCDLAWVCERSNKLVSHHLRLLRAASLVEARRDGKMVMYSLTHAGGALLDMILGEAGVPA